MIMGEAVIAVLFIVPVVLLFIVFVATDMSDQIYIFNDRPMRHKEQRIAAVLPYQMRTYVSASNVLRSTC